MQVERNEGIAGALDLADELADFLGMEQQLAGAHGVGLDMRRRGRQRRDVAADQKEFFAFDDDIGLLDLHVAGADRLDFPALEHHAGLETFFDEIVVKSLLVLDDAHCAGRSDGVSFCCGSCILTTLGRLSGSI